MRKTFGVSTQHYLFSVQTFAKAILSAGGDEYDYALRDRATKQVFADVASGDSELGVIFKTTQNEVVIDAALEEQGLEFHEVAQSAPRVALPASHPLINSTSLTLDDLEDYPYVYFSQGDDIPWEFYEECIPVRAHLRAERLHRHQRHPGGHHRRLPAEDHSAGY